MTRVSTSLQTSLAITYKQEEAVRIAVSAFLRYKITPACDINFGPLVYGSKKNHSFTIENTGVFESRFTVCRAMTDPASLERSGYGNREST